MSRRGGLAGALAAVLLLLAGVMAPGAAAADGIGATPLPFTPTIRGSNGQTVVSVTLPPGAQPIRLTGRILSTYTEPGDIIVTAGGQTIASVPATEGGPVNAAIPAEAVDDGVVVIGMQVRLEPSDDCRVDEGASATFADALLTFQRDLAPPTTIGGFFSPGVNGYVVQLPAEPSAEETLAGLNAVAALEHRVQRPTTVTLVVGEVGEVEPDTRYVRIGEDPAAEPADAGTLTLESDGTLTVSAASSALLPTVLSLDEPALGLLTVATLTNVAGTADWSPVVTTTTLQEFGVGPISFTGVGTASIPIGISQPAFGGTLQGLGVDLVGVATPIPDGGAGRIDFLWNGVLVASREMTQETDLDVSLSFAPEQLLRDNVLTVEGTYYPPGGSCKLRPLPARFDIDTRLSTLTPTFGTSVGPGFERFPQAFGATIPVAFGPAGEPARLIEQAGDLVSGLASLSPEQLTVSVVPLATALDSSSPALVVGADEAVTQQSGAPLVVGTVVVLRDADEDDRAQGQIVGPLAVAQAFAAGGRDLILLGPLPTDGGSDAGAVAAGLTSDLALEVATGQSRWAALTGEVMVLGATGQLANIPVPDTTATGPSTASLALVFGIATAIIVVGLILWSLNKPKTPAPPLPGASTT
jgi:hypothetical protein